MQKQLLAYLFIPMVIVSLASIYTKDDSESSLKVPKSDAVDTAQLGFNSQKDELSAGTIITSIYWSDGDSGKANGIPFRLYSVDAPEISGVGSWYGAKCELERKLGYTAKAFMVETTRNAKISVGENFGTDKEGRHLIHIVVGTENIGNVAIEAGHLRSWPHDIRKRLAPKPNWCS